MDPAGAAVPVESLLAHREWVRRLARALSRDDARADDLEQETWVRALERPPRHDASPRGWLGTVLRRLAVDRGRADERSRRHEAAAAGRERPVPSPQDLVAEAEAHRRVVDAVLALEEPYRSTVLLRWFEDLRPTELAARTGVPVETVRTRLRRANERIRERLGGAGAWQAALLPLIARGPDAAPPAPAGPGWEEVAIMGAKTKAAVAAGAVLALGAWWWLGGASEGGAPPRVLEEASTRPAVVGPGGAEAGSGAEDGADGSGTGGPGAGASRGAEPGATGAPRMAPSAGPADAALPEQDAISGIVRGPDGAPVAGARLRIVVLSKPLGPGETMPEPTRELVTDERGEFSLRRLGPEERNLVVRLAAEGFLPRETVVGPGTHGIELRLVAASEIAGVVVDAATGRGIAGMQVLARPPEAGPSGPAFARATDAEGRFTFPGIPEGVYSIEAGLQYRSSPAAAGPGDAGPAPRDSDAAGEFVFRRVEGVKAGTKDVRIAVERGLAIAGTMRDENGAPVAVLVEIRALGRTEQGGADYARLKVAEIRSKDGAFRVASLPPGSYDLSFTPEAPAEDAGPRPAATRVRGVAAGTEDLEVVLLPGRPIRGRILDADGKPATGDGFVYVYPPGSQAGAPDSLVLRPAADGNFATAPLDEGRSWSLHAVGFDGSLPLIVKDLRAGDPPRDFVLPAGGLLAGSVVDEEGKPVPQGVAVSAHAPGGDLKQFGSSMVSYTDAHGRFRIRGLSGQGFTVVAGGGESAFAAGEPQQGVRLGTVDLVLRARRGVEMRGRLVDEGGRGLKTRYLAALPSVAPVGVASWTRVEAEDGSFVLRGVAAGRVRLSCYRGETFTELGEFTAPADGLVVEVPAR